MCHLHFMLDKAQTLCAPGPDKTLEVGSVVAKYGCLGLMVDCMQDTLYKLSVVGLTDYTWLL